MAPTSKRKPNVPAFDHEAAFRPGYLVVSTSQAKGGVRYNRQDLEHLKARDGSEKTRHLTDKFVDNGRVVTETEALVKKADYVLKVHCTPTMFGWFADRANLSGLEEAYVELRKEADKLNRLASEVGSMRRVHVGFVAAKLVVDEFAAKEIASTIVEALSKFANALRSGAVRDFKDSDGKVIKRDQVRAAEVAHGNLVRLAHGVAGDVLKLAIESVRPEKRKVAALIDSGLSPEAAGAQADINAIENAIGFFDQGLLL